MHIGLAQLNPVLGDVAANLEKHREWMKRAAAENVELLIFPELSLAGYHLRDLVPDVALTPDSDILSQIVKASKDMSLVVGFVEETPQFRFHVGAGYMEGGRLLHVHRKVYLATYGMFDEERYLDAGAGVRAFDTKFGRCAMLICEDLWHPSAPYLACHDGAHYLLAVANSPGRGVRGHTLHTAETYERICRVYAQLLQVWVVLVNRVGFEDGVNFWGGSMVVSPMGEVTARAPLMEEALVTADLDIDEVRRARVFAPLLAEEELELTARELRRIIDDRSRE